MSKRIRTPPKPQNADWLAVKEGGSPMVSRAGERRGTNAVEAARRKKHPEITEQEEHMLREATRHLIRIHGGLFVATAVRRDQSEGFSRGVITVTVRYPNGHEGYVGDLLYDGHAFTFLSDPSEMDERVRKIAADRRHTPQENGR